jgi:predicted negative regulator of RcsB-dependent stress response
VDIAWFRDLIIIITGIIEILILIALGILGWSVYKRVKEVSESAKKISVSVQGVVDSAKASADRVASVTSFVSSEIAAPLVKVAAVIQGTSKGIDAILDIFQRRRR